MYTVKVPMKEKSNNAIKQISRAKRVAKNICNHFNVLNEPHKDALDCFYEDAIVPQKFKGQVKEKMRRNIVIQYTIRKFNGKNKKWEDYIWFEMINGDLIMKPILVKTQFPINIEMHQLMI